MKPNRAYEAVRSWLHDWNADRWEGRRILDVSGESQEAVLESIRQDGGLDYTDAEIVSALARCGYVIKPSARDSWYLVS